MKMCPRCGSDARWLGDKPDRFWWICDECGLEWDSGVKGLDVNCLEYCAENGTNIWRSVPMGCLAVFSGEEL